MAGHHLLLAFLVWANLTSVCNSHGSLTFPPARRYAVDGLSNTGQPPSSCGMPKGLGPKTSIQSGTILNVTWNLAVPHQGGYRLELLDPLERPLMDLTPVVRNSKFLNHDIRSQNQPVSLPVNYECLDCTLRWVQWASEWNTNLTFFSCADVDIVNDYSESCMGRGVFQDGKCSCRKNYEGKFCQYENECNENADCGSHGQCVDVGGTNYPRLQCYCERGWFGQKCEKDMALKSQTINSEDYNHQSLAEGIDLYWRFVKDEIEVAVHTVGNSYVAIGWRHAATTAECKKMNLLPPKPADTRKPKELSPTANVMESLSTGSTSASDLAFSSTTVQEVTSAKPVPTSRVRFPPRNFQSRPRTTTTSTIQSATTAIAAAMSTKQTTTTTTTTTTMPSTTISDFATTTDGMNDETTVQSSAFTDNFDDVRTEISVRVDEPEETDKEILGSTEKSGSVSSEFLDSGEVSGDETSRVSVDDMAALASEEIEHGVEVKSYGSDQNRKKRQAGVLHPMDCTDMVIGSVRGTVSRIFDYYSWTTATPFEDEVWGGTDDLTGAYGYEENGTTTIVFRKKLRGSDDFDVNFTPGQMHIIWARGQENDPFYTLDEVKYHGTAVTQRGVAQVNFFETKKLSPQKCHGEWSHPPNCINDKCEYKAVWEFQPGSGDTINFTIFTQHTTKWTGIGFSEDQLMNNSDVVIGWVNDNGKFFMMDMWISGYVAPLIDEVQDVDDQSGQRNSSGTTLRFTRKWDTGDKKDLSFGNGKCLYLLFPFRGGQYNAVNKKIRMHEETPAVSSQPLCLHSCDTTRLLDIQVLPAKTDEETDKPVEDSATSVDDDQSVQTTTLALETTSTVENSGLTYLIKLKVSVEKLIKLNSLGENHKKAWADRIKREVWDVLGNVSYVKDLEIDDDSLSRQGNWLIATLNVSVSETALDAAKRDPELVERVLNASVASGMVGRLVVDDSYLEVQVPSVLERLEENVTDDGEVVVEAGNNEVYVIYAASAAVIALGLLAITQIVCSIYRFCNAKNLHTSKERLISNSGWKDYSNNANSKYTYEHFNHDDEPHGKVSKHPVGSGNSSKKSQAAPPDSRSLSRQPHPPRGPPPEPERGGHYSRRSESLPRLGGSAISNMPSGSTGYGAANHSVATMPRAPSELQPDFYFMPSQRKYSGEVVRVYVDYDNPKYSGT